ncbi:hypothetical protein [Halovenus halobia]|uniref:hypothetical protein n=1 Tax=Halovenus halobia TaxID=3396622 RepID=UPI003F54F09B
MRRREYLTTVVGASTLAVAGCFGNSDTNNPRAVVSAYIETEQQGDADALSALLHSESPIEPTEAESSETNRSVDINTVTISERDLSAERLRSLNMNLPDEATTAIGDAENAVVEAEYEIDAPTVEDGGAGATSDRLSVQNSYLTAREDGEWLVVAFRLR